MEIVLFNYCQFLIFHVELIFEYNFKLNLNEASNETSSVVDFTINRVNSG